MTASLTPCLQSDLVAPRGLSQVEDRDARLVLGTPGQPDYGDGDAVLLLRPPGDPARRSRAARPGAAHETFPSAPHRPPPPPPPLRGSPRAPASQPSPATPLTRLVIIAEADGPAGRVDARAGFRLAERAVGAARPGS